MRKKDKATKKSNSNGKNVEAKKETPDIIKVIGEVQENLPNTQFRVTLDKKFGGKEINCYLSGKMRKHYIKILPGDTVEIEISRYDPNRGRIVYRK